MPSVTRSRNQRSFGGGEIGEEALGQVGSPPLDIALRKAKNWDILREGPLRIRSPMRTLFSTNPTGVADPRLSSDTKFRQIHLLGIRLVEWDDESESREFAIVVYKADYDFEPEDNANYNSDTPVGTGGVEDTYSIYFLGVIPVPIKTQRDFDDLLWEHTSREGLDILLVQDDDKASFSYQSLKFIDIQSLRVVKARDDARILFVDDEEGIAHSPIFVDFRSHKPQLPYIGRRVSHSLNTEFVDPFSVGNLSFQGMIRAPAGEEIGIRPFTPPYLVHNSVFKSPGVAVDGNNFQANTLKLPIHTPSLDRAIYERNGVRVYIPFCQNPLSPQTGFYIDINPRIGGVGGTGNFVSDSSYMAHNFPNRGALKNNLFDETEYQNPQEWYTRKPHEEYFDSFWWEGATRDRGRPGNLSNQNLKNLFPYSVFAYMTPALFNKIKFADGLGGFVLTRLPRFNSADGNTLAGYYDICCWVTRFNGRADLIRGGTLPGRYNLVLLSFPTYEAAYLRGTGLTFDQYTQYFSESMMAYPDKVNPASSATASEPSADDDNFTKWRNISQRRLYITQYSLPTFTGNDMPRVAVPVGGSIMYTGHRVKDTISVSSNLHPFKLMSDLPDQVGRIPDAVIDKLLNKPGTTDEVLAPYIPGEGSHEDAIFFYFLDRAISLKRDVALQPKHAAFRFKDKEAITWGAKLREIVLGTNIKELLVRSNPESPTGLDASSADNIHGFRGSTGVVDTGDYSICFSGPTGKEIYFLYYDESVRGMRAETATIYAPNYFDAGVARIVWDNTRNAFWCLSKDGRLALFFLSREYGLRGWTEYLFGDEVGFTDDPIKDVFQFRGQMCISNTTKIFTFKEPEYEGDQRDEILTRGPVDSSSTGEIFPEGPLITAHAEILGEATFLKHAPRGQQGDSETYITAAGTTRVKCQNTGTGNFTAIAPDADSSESILTPGADSGPDIENYDLSSFVSQSEIPLLAVKYMAGQGDQKKGIILNTSSRYVIGEE